LKAALFSTGRPVLMCPTPAGDVPDILGRNIAIAWDGSLESSRAVIATLPLLSTANKVSIYTVRSKPVPVPPDELQSYLRSHDIVAEVKLVDPKPNVAAALLSNATQSGAEILILGAYSKNQELERLLGGTTQYIVDHATMPVIMMN